MRTALKKLAREVLPPRLYMYTRRMARSLAGRAPLSAAEHAEAEENSCRHFSYDRSLLPNRYLRRLEAATTDLESARELTGLSMGYPAWNLLYFGALCSLPPGREEYTLVETGTNHGFSTIILAQALRDAGARGTLHTVDIDPAATAIAQRNVARAGLSSRVRFYTEDSHAALTRLAEQCRAFDFVFLDGSHEYAHVLEEFRLVHGRVAAAGGKVYFDNVNSGDVARALEAIRANYGGNLLTFRNCSWSPPGNAIWQP
jgi:predicted O-methyltransferase YrrM